ncbi:polymorphic toxin-type HINT domain-containing protein [Limibacter armeniacum]|uniref:polymorphic toxin-type HINT domain-containing protein n=1 Tax=Limibacter armeniacum TaxID=466084 RepID=UPI002FE5CD60
MATVLKFIPNQLDTRLIKENTGSLFVNRPITGKFIHAATAIIAYPFEDSLGNKEVINASPTHPFYSLDRRDWVPVGELKVQEAVCGRHTKLKLKSFKEVPANTVYNLEVYREHTYLVGKNEILVHNSCVPFKKVLRDPKHSVVHFYGKNKFNPG